MSEDEFRVVSLRLRALMHRRTAMHLELAASMARATAALRPMVAILQSTPVGHVMEHPELAELDLQLDGYYGDTSVLRDNDLRER